MVFFWDYETLKMQNVESDVGILKNVEKVMWKSYKYLYYSIDVKSLYKLTCDVEFLENVTCSRKGKAL